MSLLTHVILGICARSGVRADLPIPTSADIRGHPGMSSQILHEVTFLVVFLGFPHKCSATFKMELTLNECNRSCDSGLISGCFIINNLNGRSNRGGGGSGALERSELERSELETFIKWLRLRPFDKSKMVNF